MIEQTLGCSIREFFEREGEERFRDVEQETLGFLVAGGWRSVGSMGSVAAGSAPSPAATPGISLPVSEEPAGVVLSTGGGAVIRAVNRALLRGSGQVVYLRAMPEDVYRRLRHDQNRPLLQGVDPLQKLRDLFAARDPLYRETAHFSVETGRPSVAMLTNMIAMQLELAGVLPAQPPNPSP